MKQSIPGARSKRNIGNSIQINLQPIKICPMIFHMRKLPLDYPSQWNRGLNSLLQIKTMRWKI